MVVIARAYLNMPLNEQEDITNCVSK